MSGRSAVLLTEQQNLLFTL